MARVLHRALLLVRSAAGLGRQAVVERRGARWKLDLAEGIDLALYFGIYEPATVRAIERLVTPGDVALDIGANIGSHTLPLARRVGAQGRVIAFEPTDYAYGKLLVNVNLNPDLAGRVLPLQVCLVDGGLPTMPDALYSSWPLDTTRNLHPLHRGRLETLTGCVAMTLDQCLANHSIDRVDFVKLDVDGHECSVLRGAPGLLNERRPALLLELAPYCHVELGHSFAACIAPLLDAGYRLEDEASGEPLPEDARALESMVPPGSSRNVVARPKR